MQVVCTYKLEMPNISSTNVDFLVKLSKVNFRKQRTKQKTDSSNLSWQITVLMFPN